MDIAEKQEWGIEKDGYSRKMEQRGERDMDIVEKQEWELWIY